jgi:hypothetical protein
MTRYSASRGIMYTAPPATDEETSTAEVESETTEPAAADD